ncbi:murein hydrolase activator EnvC family protein [Candidatus Ruminimicrobium bovinum]|uniref:murein hydrolase activator EnvC family protein n=1 Tax=Candidatus Ruminimicrobium bovinum TaxID=3242779 RepID=UPI0039B83667
MYKITVILIILFFFFSPSVFYGDSKNEIKSKNQQLSKIKDDINKKKKEKEQLLKQEKQYKQDLQNLTTAILNTEKNLQNIRQQISSTEKNLEIASKQYAVADDEKVKANNQIQQEFLFYTQRKSVAYFDYPFEFKMRQLSIQDKSVKYKDAQKKEQDAQAKINQYDKAKKNLINLKDKHQSSVIQNKKLKQNKESLLKTTANKREQKEKEIKKLNASAKELENFINNLIKKSKAKSKTKSIRSVSIKRKTNLPWPVNGTVTVHFGKNKHPELDTNMISNGIKIKTKNNAVISSVDEGTVIFKGEFRSYGKMLIIDHKGFFYSVYGQLDKILVNENQVVAKGANIAKLASSGDAVLYFEIRQNNIADDPLLWLKPKP